MAFDPDLIIRIVPLIIVMFLLGISENKATRKEFDIYRSNVVVLNGAGFFPPENFLFW